MLLYYEDIDIGEDRELGSYTADRDELIQFAERYDPQPIHVDPAAAADTMYGGIIASGWHTSSACMALLVEGFLNDTVSLGSFGLDELRWRTPVRPEDTINVTHRITDKGESTTRDDRGYIENEVEATNEESEEVVFWRATNIFLKRADRE
jgi:acyl dehydratase